MKRLQRKKCYFIMGGFCEDGVVQLRSDFMVADGNRNINGNSSMQASIFMHELGHTLGLHKDEYLVWVW